MNREDVIRIVEEARACGETPNLRGLDLSDLNLSGVDLKGADLKGADLKGADLRGADLEGAYLRRADLRRAYLQGAYLRHTTRSILQIDYLPSGLVTFYATPAGWFLQVGCWNGTLDDLRELIAQDAGWPEAKGEEIPRRRPLLEAVITLCEAHAAYHSDAVPDLRRKWGEQHP